MGKVNMAAPQWPVYETTGVYQTTQKWLRLLVGTKLGTPPPIDNLVYRTVAALIVPRLCIHLLH